MVVGRSVTGMRDAFVERFGEDQAQAIEAAAMRHENVVHDERGSDSFRWALLICIGFECMEVGPYRADHGITAPWDEIDAWMRERTEWFKEHDGDVDYLAMFCGRYHVYVGIETEDAA